MFWMCVSIALAGVIAALCIRDALRQRRLRKLNEYLELVCAGHYELDVADNAEGELSLLQNNLLKVIVLLRTQNEKLAQDRVFLADALADISHQLKTPLTSMTVLCELLGTDLPPEKRAQFLETMAAQTDKMRWLVQSLLKLSGLDAGVTELKREQVGLRELLADCLPVGKTRVILPDKDFTFTCDRAWTGEAIGNILKNCMEHTPNGTVTVTVGQTNLYAWVRIEDTGGGIDETDLPHIFERFYRGKNARPDSIGIGLALAKSIIERQRGSITAENTTLGARFEIRFYKAVV